MSQAGSSAQRRPVFLPVIAVIIVALGASVWLRSRAQTPFPYSGTWVRSGTAKIAPESFTFSSGGTCSLEYGNKQETNCTYSMVEGSATVEYFYELPKPEVKEEKGKPKKPPGYSRTWYKAKLIPSKNGEGLTLRLLDGANLMDGANAGKSQQLPVLGTPAVEYKRQ